jgi:class III poly(R)-hydroxyalkanoic acid synthase PhaE subunit
MDRTKDFFDTWLKSQEDMYGNLTEMTKRFQQSFWGLGSKGGGMPGFGDIQHAYTSWTSAVMNALRDTGTGDMNFIQETLSKTLGGSNAYLKLYEMWTPLFRAIQERSVKPDTYKNLTDPAHYKEMLDKVFGFNPEAVSQVSEQAAKLLETFAEFMEGRPESLMTIFHNLFHAFDSTVGRVFHVPAVGKDREKVELLLRSMDDLSVFLAKNTEYQQMMYVTGLAAFEKVIATVAEKVSKGEEMKGFDEFFDLWLNVSEKTYYALFKTEDFSKRQGELLEASLNVRKHFFKLMELYLYDFPVAVRSEMDDLYKTIYDLKKKVKSLEKQVMEVSA